MISYKVASGVLTITVTGLDKDIADLRLSVIVDRREMLDPKSIVARAADWQVRLPAPLFDGKPHRVALDVASNENSLARTAFSFAASTQPVRLTRPD